MRLVNRIGPRKLKSLPFLEAQKVYPVNEQTTAEVRTNASRTILPEKIQYKINHRAIIMNHNKQKIVNYHYANNCQLKCTNSGEGEEKY